MVNEFDLSGDGTTLLRSMAHGSIDIFRNQFNEAKEAAAHSREGGANDSAADGNGNGGRARRIGTPPRRPDQLPSPTRRSSERHATQRRMSGSTPRAASQGQNTIRALRPTHSRDPQSLDRLPGGFRTQASLIEAFTTPMEGMEKKQWVNRNRVAAQQSRMREWQDQTKCSCHQLKTCPGNRANLGRGARGGAPRPKPSDYFAEFYRREDEKIVKAALEKWLVKLRDCTNDESIDDMEVRDYLMLRFWEGTCLMSRGFPSRSFPDPPLGQSMEELDELATETGLRGEETDLLGLTENIRFNDDEHHFLVFDPWSKQGFYEFRTGTLPSIVNLLPTLPQHFLYFDIYFLSGRNKVPFLTEDTA